MALPFPILFDQYKIGPGEVSLIANDINSMGTAKISKSMNANIKSNNRFILSENMFGQQPAKVNVVLLVNAQ